MRFSQSYAHETNQILIVVGNGSREEKLLEAIAPKFNGSKITLALPGLPRPRKTGLAALEILPFALDRGYIINKALFIIDKEHVDEIAAIYRKLQEHGFAIEEERKLNRKSLLLTIVRGPRKIDLYIAICGDRRSIEEELARLFYAIYGEMIEPGEVKRRVKIRELIGRAGREKLIESLECLAQIMLEIHGTSSE